MSIELPDRRLQFYRACVDEFIPEKAAKVLIVAGGQSDKKVIESLGFVSAVFSNIDPTHAGAEQFAPYEFNYQVRIPRMSVQRSAACRATIPRDGGPAFRGKPVQGRAGRDECCLAV